MVAQTSLPWNTWVATIKDWNAAFKDENAWQLLVAGSSEREKVVV